jgi:hypothetical protein
VTDIRDLAFLNAAFIGFEVAKWAEIVEGALTLLGAATLLILNLFRLWRMWNEHRKVDNP